MRKLEKSDHNRALSIIPDIITLSRIFLTYVFVSLQNKLYCNIADKGIYLWLITIFLIICVTDLIDGKIARSLKENFIMGSILDVTADAIFIFSSVITLNVHKVLPVWFTVIILMNFVVFIVTSLILKKIGQQTKQLFIFDFIGRLAAALFYIIPGLTYILSYIIGDSALFSIKIVMYITSALTIISFCVRCSSCLQAVVVTASKSSKSVV